MIILAVGSESAHQYTRSPRKPDDTTTFDNGQGTYSVSGDVNPPTAASATSRYLLIINFQAIAPTTGTQQVASNYTVNFSTGTTSCQGTQTIIIQPSSPTYSISGRVRGAHVIDLQMSVNAQVEWRDTGIALSVGDNVKFTYLSGTWTVWKGVDSYTDAEGKPGIHDPCTLLPSENTGGLVAQVGNGSPMFIGNSVAFTAQKSGLLKLSINDCLGQFANNDGTITEEIILTPPGSMDPAGVSVSDNAGHSTFTDDYGDYLLTGLAPGTYNITASASGITFAQSPRAITVPPDKAGVDFVGTSSLDTDGDGLPNEWEINGIDGINLPAMGADPNIKDIFVQVDWMEDATHQQKPDSKAIEMIVKSFADSGVDGGKGIRLHVDMGPNSILDYATGKKWGSLGKGHIIPFKSIFGHGFTSTLGSDINTVLNDGLPRQSSRVFHYALFVYKRVSEYGVLTDSSGISFADKQVFVISLGFFNEKGSMREQAGTFMHELGHNLGLQHGGNQNDVDPNIGKELFNNKPNYLSVMNYSFQMTGLIIDGNDGYFDYSRSKVPSLNEARLAESFGLNIGAGPPRYGTKYHMNNPSHCFPDSYFQKYNIFFAVVNYADQPIDWNCNGHIDGAILGGTVQTDINGSGGDTQVLDGYDDWSHLNFKMGNIGLGFSAPPVSITSEDVARAPKELAQEEDLHYQRISEPRVHLSSKSSLSVALPGETITYSTSMFNMDATAAKDVEITVVLPPGFTYVAGSTQGVTTSDPVGSDPVLTWTGPFNIQANGGELILRFDVIASSAIGQYVNVVTGSSSNGIVIPEDNTAPVTVSLVRFHYRYIPLIRV